MQMFPYSSKWLIKLSDLTNLIHSGIPSQAWGEWKVALNALLWVPLQSVVITWFQLRAMRNKSICWVLSYPGRRKSAGAVCLGMLCAALPSRDLALLQCLACGMQQNCLALRKGKFVLPPGRVGLWRGLKSMVGATFKNWTRWGANVLQETVLQLEAGLTFNPQVCKSVTYLKLLLWNVQLHGTVNFAQELNPSFNHNIV